MSCFYCAGAKVTSEDVGACEGACEKNVCVAGTSKRPNDYHAEPCNCGCPKLICIFDMRAHAKEHGSTPSNCFPNSSAHSGLIAGDAIESSGEFRRATAHPKTAKHGRAVYRFIELVRIPGGGVLTAVGPRMDIEGVAEAIFEPFEKWERLAAALAPHVVRTIAACWPHVSDDLLRLRVGDDLKERLETFRADGYANVDERFASAIGTQAILQSWFKFSPRLTMLIVQRGSERSLLARALRAGLPGFGVSVRQHWTEYPGSLGLRDLVPAGFTGGSRGGTDFSADG